MTRLVLLAVFFGIGLTTMAQTRRIAHRAHSGAVTDNYDGKDGNYGGGHGMYNQGQYIIVPVIPSPVILTTDTVKTKDGRDSTCYRWDTLRTDSPPRVNDVRHQPVRRISQLGYICAPTTTQ
jgi:hypothetical protein